MLPTRRLWLWGISPQSCQFLQTAGHHYKPIVCRLVKRNRWTVLSGHPSSDREWEEEWLCQDIISKNCAVTVCIWGVSLNMLCKNIFALLCKSLRPPLDLLFSQTCNDYPYLFLSVFIKMQPENTGNIYIILKNTTFSEQNGF